MASKKIMVIGTSLLLLIGGGGTAAFFLMSGSNQPAVAAQVEAPVIPKPPVYVQMEPINVPVMRDDRKRHVYAVFVNLQVQDDKHRDLINSLMPRLRDAFLRRVNGAPLPAVEGSDAIDLDLLKQRLSEQAEKVLGPEVVEDILFMRVIRLMG